MEQSNIILTTKKCIYCKKDGPLCTSGHVVATINGEEDQTIIASFHDECEKPAGAQGFRGIWSEDMGIETQVTWAMKKRNSA